MTKSLFDDFNHVSAKAWKQKRQIDLKGADNIDTQNWRSLEGIDRKHFYNSVE